VSAPQKPTQPAAPPQATRALGYWALQTGGRFDYDEANEVLWLVIDD
jgi:hypothetical protein